MLSNKHIVIEQYPRRTEFSELTQFVSIVMASLPKMAGVNACFSFYHIQCHDRAQWCVQLQQITGFLS
jgi:hypothetical protein